VLTWIGEQYGVRRDHLALLLGRAAQADTKTPGQLAATTVKDWVQRWRRVGILDSASILVGEPGWVWLTRKGLEHLEQDYRYWEPKERGLAHLHAINQARLWVDQRQPGAIWRSERQMYSERPGVGNPTGLEHRPDAEVQIGEHLVAIEVELKAKKPKQMPAILYGLARTYDGIWYFCPPALEKPLRQSFGQLDAAARRKFSLVLLPQERPAATGKPATPPRPASGA
jgi:hypothetical protein